MTPPTDTHSLVNSLITNIAIPELMKWLRSRHPDPDSLPTDEQAIAHFHANVAGGVSEADAFLALKGAG